jgi:signal transduction histidine kinase
MKRVALAFALSVFAPSLLLAWLAIGFIRDQQIIFERQQTLLLEERCGGLVKDVYEAAASHQAEFGRHVETLLADRQPSDVATQFDEWLIKIWPLAEVGFVVSADGSILSPTLLSRPEAKRFRVENDLFLSNQEKIYWPSVKEEPHAAERSSKSKTDSKTSFGKGFEKSRKDLAPKTLGAENKEATPQVPGETEFRQMIGESTQGILPRFLQNRLKLLMWYRSPSSHDLIFGSQVNVSALNEDFRKLFKASPPLDEFCLALLDDNGRPVAQSHLNFAADWKRPFVAVEVGNILPHWEVAAYPLNPAQLSQSSRTLTLTLSLLVAVLLSAIGVGSWLIVADLKRQLALARQKSDFVSNVSHELKTPLTSIRMFSELLVEDRVSDEAKKRSYLHIISAEAARLTRLINNVLDFARMERGEKKYQLEKQELTGIVRDTLESYRPQLESNGFTVTSDLLDDAVFVNADRDAISQILVNLLSNAEKYSGAQKEIHVAMVRGNRPGKEIIVTVSDRGSGVPPECEEKIFEQFFRAHDSLSSGIQGSGLGLTLARQMARAHGGDVTYERRTDGGSSFSLRLPLGEVRNP